MNILDMIFGKLPGDLILERSEDPRFKKALKYIYFFRALFFPLALLVLTIYCIFLFIEVLNALQKRIILMTKQFLKDSFCLINDSSWVKLQWFGIKQEEFEEEFIKCFELYGKEQGIAGDK